MSCSCGHQHTNATLLAESDADKEAIADLTRQAKAESGPMATLIRARRDQLKAEVKAEEAFAKALKTSAIDLSKTIEAAINTGRVQSILGYNDQQLLEFILQSGLGLAVDEFIEQTSLIRQAVQKSISTIKATNYGTICLILQFIQCILCR